MTALAPPREPSRSRDPLLRPLAALLPGLGAALDEDAVVDGLAPLVVEGAHVVAAAARSVWFADDGSCSLRYRVEVATRGGRGRPDHHLVLARVCPSAAAARRHLDEARALVPDTPPPAPWQEWLWQGADASVALHLFPIDPAVPTLPSVTGLEQLRPRWLDAAASIEVVRHPRIGGVVLRCRTPSAEPTAAGAPTCYAKVYPDTTGATVHRFLSSLPSGVLSSSAPDVRLPRPLGYRPDLRLLLTEALPGEPALPALVGQVVAGATGGPQAALVTELRAAVREAGRVLAALHATTDAAAPDLPPGQVQRDLVHQLQVVGQVWPATAGAIRATLGTDLAGATASDGDVLCHGDYTPSQVLFSSGHASGLVDFDTVGWGDRATDLGRFLAHLDLSLAKAEGVVPQPLGRELRQDFLEAYASWTSRPTDDALLVRVETFRALALAITALHACRQLKERRLDLALSLLGHRLGHPVDDSTRRNS